MKNRFTVGSMLLLASNLVSGILILAPFLVFLKIHLESSGLAMKLWPFMSIDVIGDLLINHSQALQMYLLSAIVIFFALFPLRMLFSAAVYRIIIEKEQYESADFSFSEVLGKAVKVWPGFLKADIIAAPLYVITLFLGFTVGGLLGKVLTFLKPVTIVIFLLAASSYLQILKANMISKENSSIRNSVRQTKPSIAASLMRIIAGNVSVVIVTLIPATIIFLLLRFVKSYNWNLLTAILALICQQLIVILICLAQALRINFNNSILKKGD